MSRRRSGGRVFVVGVGMSKFHKPKKVASQGPHYPELAHIAVSRALQDACISPDEIELAVVGNMFAGGGAGQRSLYEMGLFDIPVFNVSNACATGSSAMYLAREMVAGGRRDCCLALGVEKMRPGSLGGGDAKGSPSSLDLHARVIDTKFGLEQGKPAMPQYFGNAGREHQRLYGTTNRQFAMIGEKNHRHSVNNPYAQFRDVYTLEQVEKSRMIHDPLTKLQCSPTSDGAAAAIVCSEEFVVKHRLQGQAVEVAGMSFRTDASTSFEADQLHGRSVINAIGFPMARAAAEEAYAEAGITPDDVQVVELHDCFSCNELLTYESLMLCKEGEGGKLVESGNCTYGGKYVINPSGGLISKGHPLGATGVAQVCELSWQLRNDAGLRQVKGARVALQHNLGLGGAVMVAVYKSVPEWRNIPPKRARSGGMGFESEDVPSLNEIREMYGQRARL